MRTNGERGGKDKSNNINVYIHIHLVLCISIAIASNATKVVKYGYEVIIFKHIEK
jgi:hypothetical protein